VPLIDNVSVEILQKGPELKESLIHQIKGRVRWRESILAMAEQGITTTIEMGAGKVLTGLSKRIAPSLEAFSLNTPYDIETFLKNDLAQ
jgi:[acyl-carrier-protein] S-malonyltransferase